MTASRRDFPVHPGRSARAAQHQVKRAVVVQIATHQAAANQGLAAERRMAAEMSWNRPAGSPGGADWAGHTAPERRDAGSQRRWARVWRRRCTGVRDREIERAVAVEIRRTGANPCRATPGQSSGRGDWSGRETGGSLLQRYGSLPSGADEEVKTGRPR